MTERGWDLLIGLRPTEKEPTRDEEKNNNGVKRERSGCGECIVPEALSKDTSA